MWMIALIIGGFFLSKFDNKSCNSEKSPEISLPPLNSQVIQQRTQPQPLYAWKDTKTIDEFSKNVTSTVYHFREMFSEKCGVIFNFHINKCGGGMLQRWLKQRTKRYLTLMVTPSSKWRRVGADWKELAIKATKCINETSSNEWSALEIHHDFPGKQVVCSNTW